MRKIIAALLAASMMGLAACGNENGGADTGGRDRKPDKSLYVVMVAGAGEQGGGSLNDRVWTEIQRAEEELGIVTNFLEAETEDDYDNKIGMALDGEADLIICVGEGWDGAAADAAADHPEQNFIIVNGVVDADNVISLTGNKQESGGADKAVYSIVENFVKDGLFEGGN